MYPVLYRIPTGAPWFLPAGILLALLLAFGAWLATREPDKPRSLKRLLIMLAVTGVAAFFGLRFAAAKTPDVPIYGFGVMLFIAFVSCTWLASWRAEKEGIAREHIQDLAIWLFVGGLVGARAVFLLLEVHVQSVGEFLWQLPRIWDGGVVFYGAALGGLVGYGLAWYFIVRKHNLSTLKLVDIIAPSAALGLALGRVGCLLNGCCYGQVVCPDCRGLTFPLSAPAHPALVYHGWQSAAGFVMADDPIDSRMVGAVVPDSPAEAAGLRPGDVIVAVNGEKVGSYGELNALLAGYGSTRRDVTDLRLTVRHANGEEEELPAFAPRTLPLYPTQLYETISMVLIFLVLTFYFPFRRHDGEVMALLMICYGVHRYVNELLRGDQRPVGFEAWTSVLLVVGGLALGLWLLRKPAQYRPGEAATPRPAATGPQPAPQAVTARAGK